MTKRGREGLVLCVPEQESRHSWLAPEARWEITTNDAATSYKRRRVEERERELLLRRRGVGGSLCYLVASFWWLELDVGHSLRNKRPLTTLPRTIEKRWPYGTLLAGVELGFEKELFLPCTTRRNTDWFHLTFIRDPSLFA